MTRAISFTLFILFHLWLKAGEPAFNDFPAADSLRLKTPGGIFTCRVESLHLDTRWIKTDSLERKATWVISFLERSDSTRHIVWSGSWKNEKTDTVRMNSTAPPAGKSRGWRRWIEPVFAFSTLSSMVYLFYSVRSK
jgi:hypothetical protein